ncbi:MAG: hypothetical protein MJ120_06300 [Clostridia bacterium]|nr:hypothetical protein [Clostridia bacterium]
MRKIYVSDFTLKELVSERRVPLLFREKTAIAKCIDNFGADAIELAEIKNVKEDTIVYRTIASAVKNSAVAIPVGFTVDGIENAWNCIKDAVKPCLQVALPVSTVQMEYSYHVKDKKMLVKIAELCTAAKEKCADVEFVAMDATRADADFVKEVCKTAVENGATAVTICDDAGISMPVEFSELVKAVKSECDVPVYVKVSDNINMAVAVATYAVMSGADGVKTAVTGKNVLLTDELADIITVKGESLGICTSLQTTGIHRDIDVMLKSVSQDSLIEANESKDSDKSDIFLDSSSTLPQLSEAVSNLGYDLSDEDLGNVYKALMRVCDKKSCVGSKELEALIASSAMQVPSTYHVKSYNTTSGNLISAMANIILTKDDEEICGVSVGDGPIDAAFRAIESSIGYHYELDDFQIQAVTGGKESIGSAFVRLRSNGKLYSGNGISTDIVGASIRAYVNALNKIVFEEN